MSRLRIQNAKECSGAGGAAVQGVQGAQGCYLVGTTGRLDRLSACNGVGSKPVRKGGGQVGLIGLIDTDAGSNVA